MASLLKKTASTPVLLGIIALLLAANLFRTPSTPPPPPVEAPAHLRVSETGANMIKEAKDAALITQMSHIQAHLQSLQLSRQRVVNAQRTEERQHQAYLMNHKAAVAAVAATIGGANAAADTRKSDADRFAGGIVALLGLGVSAELASEVAEVTDQIAQHEARTKQFKQHLAELDSEISATEATLRKLRHEQ